MSAPCRPAHSNSIYRSVSVIKDHFVLAERSQFLLLLFFDITVMSRGGGIRAHALGTAAAPSHRDRLWYDARAAFWQR
jgi:hypothetical protein